MAFEVRGDLLDALRGGHVQLRQGGLVEPPRSVESMMLLELREELRELRSGSGRWRSGALPALLLDGSGHWRWRNRGYRVHRPRPRRHGIGAHDLRIHARRHGGDQAGI